MGLDIYLNWFDNYEETKATEAEYERLSALNWAGRDIDEEYNKLTEEEKKALRDKDKEIATNLGLDHWGTMKDETKVKSIEKDCERYPDHYFKVGYFRSSYNGGGIEKVLKNLGLDTLHDIFDYDREAEEYYFQPNWDRALVNVKRVIEDLKGAENIRCHSVSDNMFKESTIFSEKEAIEIYNQQRKKYEENKDRNPDFSAYSNSDGTFYMEEPMEVIAMIPGKENMFIPRDCVYVITKSDNSWYVQALEIVQETIEYVLDQKDKEKYYLSWSG